MPAQPAPPGNRARRAEERERPLASALGLPAEHVSLIEQSHERCVALGLSRIERPDFSPVGRPELTVARERNLRLHGHAAPVMEMLYEQIANTHSMVVLTDATGVVIHSIGDDDFLARAAKVALAPGANWSESAKGTNAVGPSLVTETPTLVHADEHFLHANHFLTCSAAPILDPRGNILGVLDVSGDHRSYHQHTMALVKMSARMIENQWLSDHYRHAMRLHFHARVGHIGTLMEGILAVSADGRIVGGNRVALEQLGISSAALRMRTVMSLFGVSLGALVDHFRSPLALPLQLRTEDGRPFHVHARFNWPVWSQVTEAAAAAAPARMAVPLGGEPFAPESLAESLADPVDERPDTAAPVLSSDAEAPAPQARPATVHTGLHVATAADLPPEGAADRAAALRRDRQDARQGLSHAAHPSDPVRRLSQLQLGDPQIDALVGKLRRVVDHDIPVLILGESGTGKELLARALHGESSRAQQPFVAVNCATLPHAALEGELFGFEDGVFSGPRAQGQIGKIRQAHGGTLFLDEIGELPLAVQAQLLRVLQERQLVPLGGARALPVDIALVCGSQHNVRDLIDARQFRQDLYYRLNGLSVRLPSLRERTDFTALVRHLLDGPVRAPHLSLSSETLGLMQNYAWPGNVRQLFNVLRAAALMAGQERWIRPDHLPEDFLDDWRRSGATAGVESAQLPAASSDAARPGLMQAYAPPPTLMRPLHEVEREAIQRAVDEAGGNISVAAKRLGVSRNTIYRRLRWNEASSA